MDFIRFALPILAIAGCITAVVEEYRKARNVRVAIVQQCRLRQALGKNMRTSVGGF